MDEESRLVCGAYLDSGDLVPIVAYPEEGDIVVEFSAMGDILLENVIVHDPRCTEGLNLTGVFKKYDADGVFSTQDSWAVIKGDTVSFYRFTDMDHPYHVVDTSFNISYESI